MLRVLVADDETAVRRGLRNTIDWNKYGFELVGEADDGTTALDLAEQMKPDIIIMDICMPVMDGLECLKALKEKNNSARTIILSGHDSFDFAQDSMRYGVFSYVLKPVDNSELIEQLLALKDDIEKVRRNSIEFDRLRVLVQENHLMLKERFLYNLVKGAFSEYEEIFKNLDFFKVKGLSDAFVVMVADIDNYPLPFEGLNEEERQIKKFAMVDIAEQKISSLGDGCAFNGTDQQFIILLGLENEKSESIQYKRVFTLCEEIKDAINELLGFTITIGVSKVVRGIQTIKKSYKEAIEAVNHKLWIGNDSIIFLQDIQIEKAQSSPYQVEAEAEILIGIKACNIDIATNGVVKFFNNLLEVKGLDIQQIREMILRLVYQIDRILIDAGIDYERVSRHIQVQSIFQFQTLNDLTRYIDELVKKTILFLNIENKSKFRYEINKAISYINDHYSEPIDLNMVAEHIHLSMYYVSRLFKKETGRSVIDYLNEIRVENAKIMLKETDLKLYEIAEKVGYHDNVYFGQIFKKYTNVCPGDYRRKLPSITEQKPNINNNFTI